MYIYIYIYIYPNHAPHLSLTQSLHATPRLIAIMETTYGGELYTYRCAYIFMCIYIQRKHVIL